MEETSRADTDHYPEPGTHATECGTIITSKKNALLELRECDGCGEQHVVTRAHIGVLAISFGLFTTAAFLTGNVVSSPAWTAEFTTMVNSVLGAGAGIGTAWFLANMQESLEINDGDSR